MYFSIVKNVKCVYPSVLLTHIRQVQLPLFFSHFLYFVVSPCHSSFPPSLYSPLLILFSNLTYDIFVLISPIFHFSFYLELYPLPYLFKSFPLLFLMITSQLPITHHLISVSSVPCSVFFFYSVPSTPFFLYFSFYFFFTLLFFNLPLYPTSSLFSYSPITSFYLSSPFISHSFLSTASIISSLVLLSFFLPHVFHSLLLYIFISVLSPSLLPSSSSSSVSLNWQKMGSTPGWP